MCDLKDWHGRWDATPPQMVEKCYRTLFELSPTDPLPGRPAEPVGHVDLDVMKASLNVKGSSLEVKLPSLDVKEPSCDADLDLVVKGPITDLTLERTAAAAEGAVVTPRTDLKNAHAEFKRAPSPEASIRARQRVLAARDILKSVEAAVEKATVADVMGAAHEQRAVRR